MSRPRPGRASAHVLARVIDAATWAGARTPVGVAHGLAALGGTIEWAVRPGKRRRLAENLAHAVRGSPRDRSVRRLVRHEIRNEAHRSADLLWALGRPTDFLDTTTVTGVEAVQTLVSSGSGAVLVGTHLGGWEVATSIPAAYLPTTTHVIVADDWLAWAIEHARVAAGLDVLYAGRAALEGPRLLRRGHCLLVLGDDATFATRRQRVRFLDSEAELAAGVVALARLGRAPIVNFTVLPLAHRRWQVSVDPPIAPPADSADDRRVLQELADLWTADITAAPEHWAASFPIAWADGVSGGPEVPS